MTDQLDSGSAQERRRFFRVSDQVAIRYKIFAADDPKVFLDNVNTGASAVNLLENQIADALSKVRTTHPVLLEVLELFNQKINMMFINDGMCDVHAQPRELKEVSLSACGMAFTVPGSVSLGQKVALDMLLFPSYVNLLLQGLVVSSEPVEDGASLLRVDFTEVSEIHQELLVQHVIKRQSSELKARREAREKSD
ncbi:MAG: PilZ domain-containing protein [Pseudomonadales bacterium]|nr:PilZ domain-containing protein [Pseudomonadales bacterium]